MPKRCQCCGCVDSNDQRSCAVCGEGSWSVADEALDTDLPAEELSAEEPAAAEEPKRRRGRK